MRIAARHSSTTGGENLTGLFPIHPGKHTAVIKLPDQQADRAHFNVHVDAQPMERNIDFTGRPEPAKPSFSLRNVCFSGCIEVDGVTQCDQQNVDATTLTGWTCVNRPIPGGYQQNGDPTDAAKAYLQRPASYVPFLVPRYSPTKTASSTPAPGQLNPSPVYDWGYRPEMQFSLFDLKLAEIKVQKGADGQVVNVLNAATSLPRETSRVLVEYALSESDTGALRRFGSDRQLVFGSGGAKDILPGNCVRGGNDRAG